MDIFYARFYWVRCLLTVVPGIPTVPPYRSVSLISSRERLKNACSNIFFERKRKTFDVKARQLSERLKNSKRA